PNYMCVLPKIVSDFVTEHREWFRDKTLITLVTYANFFFDADLQIGRLLQKLNIPFELNSNISVQMPMVICDMKYIKRTDDETMRRFKEQAEVKLDECARRILAGSSVHDGQESDRLKAFLRQRMFYGGKMSRDFAGLHVSANCTGCGLCIRSCPTRNLALKEGRAEQQGRCTQCYRCASNCPEQAISLWTKQIQWQYPGITA
ncbi:MAG: EFR1 family ferrodoxin, partial [Coriobacteriales bacterium]|nr:EFR1 family ferrodoxin [Coriobacteriales bacterium]